MSLRRIFEELYAAAEAAGDARRQLGHIPAEAEGVCYPPTKNGVWRVAFTWEVTE